MKDHIYRHVYIYLTTNINREKIVNPLSDLSRLYTQFKRILNCKSIVGFISKLNTRCHSPYISLYGKTMAGNLTYNSGIFLVQANFLRVYACSQSTCDFKV